MLLVLQHMTAIQNVLTLTRGKVHTLRKKRLALLEQYDAAIQERKARDLKKHYAIPR